MLFTTVSVVGIGLGYFIALLLADRMERLAFEAASEADRVLINEARPYEKGFGLATLFIILPPMIALSLDSTDFLEVDFLTTMLRLFFIVCGLIAAFFYTSSSTFQNTKVLSTFMLSIIMFLIMAVPLNNLDFSDFNMSMIILLLICVVFGAIAGLWYYRSSSYQKYVAEQQKIKAEKHDLPKAYRQSLRRANLLRIIALIVFVLCFVIII